MQLDRDTADLLATIGAAAGVLGLLLALVAQVRLSRMRKAYEVLQGSGRRDDFVTAVGRHVAEVGDLRGEVGRLREVLGDVRSDLADALRHVAVVRYDAFPDMGGQMSFSAAFVDENGDGLVITSINGRSETRTYAKAVRALSSVHNLSQEELQAIDAAVAGEGRGDAQPASSSAR